MNVDNVKPGGVEKHSERPVEIARPPRDTKTHPAAPAVDTHRAHDSATISDAGRDTARRVHDLAGKLREPDSDRKGLVAAARERLNSGELDTEAVYRSVAERLLGGR
jgi:hypothetical protein